MSVKTKRSDIFWGIILGLLLACVLGAVQLWLSNEFWKGFGKGD
ncbi:MAG: hypothetical protein Q8Q08_06815 [Candidatus Omnitrophota bacterium]|nr:hypothetical protein [Candidatus Omnitrophota bacterium]